MATTIRHRLTNETLHTVDGAHLSGADLDVAYEAKCASRESLRRERDYR